MRLMGSDTRHNVLIDLFFWSGVCMNWIVALGLSLKCITRRMNRNEYENGTSALGLHFQTPVCCLAREADVLCILLATPTITVQKDWCNMQKGCRNYLLLLAREIEGERCVAGDQGQKWKSPKKFRSALRRWTEWTEELMNVENGKPGQLWNVERRLVQITYLWRCLG